MFTAYIIKKRYMLIMTDEQQRTYLESIRRTRFKTLIMTAHIDKAVEEMAE